MTDILRMGMNMAFDLCDPNSIIAMSGSLCLPVYPSRAKISANDNVELVDAYEAFFAKQAVTA